MRGPEKSSQSFSRESHKVPNKLTLYFNTLPNTIGLCPKLKNCRQQSESSTKNRNTSSANQNQSRETLQLRQPIGMEYYVTGDVGQSESGITLPESSRLGWKTHLGARFQSHRRLTPPDQLTLLLLIHVFWVSKLMVEDSFDNSIQSWLLWSLQRPVGSLIHNFRGPSDTKGMLIFRQTVF